ncbi:MAG TPA: hypothetical protein VHG28_25190 [Longimicrobiaceae bacterium]|nr:hypothetical protein [Longimicrobiaceae bacterium]
MPQKHRSTLLKGALAALVLAAGLLASPHLVPDAYAEMAGCTATCREGTCWAQSGDGKCICTCDAPTGLPRCSCTQLKPSVDG